jgi:hypothetical protein
MFTSLVANDDGGLIEMVHKKDVRLASFDDESSLLVALRPDVLDADRLIHRVLRQLIAAGLCYSQWKLAEMVVEEGGKLEFVAVADRV